jgi:hypothetical protein
VRSVLGITDAALASLPHDQRPSAWRFPDTAHTRSHSQTLGGVPAAEGSWPMRAGGGRRIRLATRSRRFGGFVRGAHRTPMDRDARGSGVRSNQRVKLTRADAKVDCGNMGRAAYAQGGVSIFLVRGLSAFDASRVVDNLRLT